MTLEGGEGGWVTLGGEGGWGEWGGGGWSWWLYVKSSVLVQIKMVENTSSISLSLSPLSSRENTSCGIQRSLIFQSGRCYDFFFPISDGISKSIV